MEEKNCFSVGFRSCGGIYDKYIDDISGLDQMIVKHVGQSQLQEFDTFFCGRKEHAYSEFRQDILSEILTIKSFNEVISSVSQFNTRITSEFYTKDTNEGATYGYAIYVTPFDYVETRIFSIKINAKKEGRLIIKLIDLDEHTIIRTETKTVKKGLQKIDIGYIHKNDFNSNLFIGIEIIDCELFAVLCNEVETACNCSCECEEDFGMLNTCGELSTHAIRYLTQPNFCVDYEIGCNIDDFICKNNGIFLDAYYYKLAKILVDDKINGYGRSYYENANNINLKEVVRFELEETYKQRKRMAMSKLKKEILSSPCFSCDELFGKSMMIGSFV